MRGAATQIASRQFDDDFFQLTVTLQAQVQKKLDEMSSRLEDFPHYRMVESDRYRLRVGDYRIIYRFNLTLGEIYLLAIGHRAKIYRH